MQLLTYVKTRLKRRLDVQALGPNEARIVYDTIAASIGALLVLLFSAAYVDATRGRLTPLLATPLLLVAFSAIFGIYSRYRMATGRVKAAVILLSLVNSALAALLLGTALPAVILWTLLVYPLLALPRLLLGLPYSRHSKLISIAVRQRGPVLVIGGAGYIGSHTVDLLLQQGREVRVLDRLMYGRKALAEFLESPHFELINGDVTDIAKLTLAMRGVSSVVHLAGLVGDPACAVDPVFTRHTNIVATRMAKEVAQSMGVHRFVFASSCSVYGVSDREVCETDKLNPVSLYAQTKIDSEKELLSAVRDEFFVTILRFATVFGHSRRPRFDLVANLFTAQAMVDGVITVVGPNQWRPFIHVRDLARAIVSVLQAEPALVQSQIFNVGDQRLNMTIQQLAERVRDVCGRYRAVSITVKESPQDLRNYAVSFSKMRSMLGFEAATLMEAGIGEMAEAFHRGKYGHYREQIYSNVAMTAEALSHFQDPEESSRLYAPLK